MHRIYRLVDDTHLVLQLMSSLLCCSSEGGLLHSIGDGASRRYLASGGHHLSMVVCAIIVGTGPPAQSPIVTPNRNSKCWCPSLSRSVPLLPWSQVSPLGVGTGYSVDLDLAAPPVAARATAGDKESEVSEVRLPQEAALASPLSPA